MVRFSRSAHGGQFFVKGAMLFSLWTGRLHRQTRDLDLLGYGESSQEALTQIFRDVCVVDVPADGLALHPDSVRVTEIREGQH